MSVNKYLPHVVILPEDDANRQIAVGFAIQCTSKQLKIEKEVGGWGKVVDLYLNEYVKTMNMYEGRIVILLIDCDEDENRVGEIRRKIPECVAGRTFVLGCKSEPEALRKAGMGSFEKIGISIAQECHDNTSNIWEHNLLAHNLDELNNLREASCNIIMPN